MNKRIGFNKYTLSIIYHNYFNLGKGNGLNYLQRFVTCLSQNINDINSI